MSYTISVDTGGTFTDVVVSDESGRFTIGKALTTKDRIFVGIRGALENAADGLGIPFSDLISQAEMLIYGTTRATNAIVTKTTAKTAFLTTQGFKDTLLLREGGKTGAHDFSRDYPDPYIARRHTFEIEERMSAEGTASTPLNEAQAIDVIKHLRDKGFEAVGVSLIWSVANPEHELRIGELLDEYLPGVPYTLSHQLIPIIREYRRASATAIDASLKPLMQHHLRELEDDVRAAGFTGELLVSTTAGGCTHVAAVTEKPITTIGSGPAMAPIAARYFSDLEKFGGDVIVCDTGGTTFDVGLVREGQLVYTRDTWIGPMWTGHLLGISAVDMRSIGAGGGSIAWIDEGGLMRVGPQSAGADPGPACYGRGGTLPTVSDAAVVLGYFDPDNFLGGRMKLDKEAARRAVASVADPLGIPIEVAAYQILTLAGDFMMRAVSDITINEGFDPRESAVVAGGGAAGLNIMTIAQELGCRRVILPKVASVLSASGMQYADIVAEEAASLVTISTRFDFDAVNGMLADLTQRLEQFRTTLGDRGGDYRVEYVAEARYLAQNWELDAPLSNAHFGGQADVDVLVNAFHDVHERVFSVRDEQSPVEIINWKARLIASLPVPDAPAYEAKVDGPIEAVGHRDCYFGSTEPVKTAIFEGDRLATGFRIEGPALVVEPTTTLVVYPDMSVEVSETGNYILNIA
ncbi:MAG: hydantoinase/oxoprolinase family protein [Sphingobium sp.]